MFTNLGHVIDQQVAQMRLGNARTAFIKLSNVWSSSFHRLRTDRRIFKSNVQSVFCAAVACRMENNRRNYKEVTGLHQLWS